MQSQEKKTVPLATFENNFFAETENVSACANKDGAGTAKTIEYMKTEDFYNEISAAGGIYRFSQGETPLLPNVKYSVFFTVTPSGLTGAVIKVNGQETANFAELEAGTYPVEITADNCETLNTEITITADTATHTQTFTLTYKDADYKKVDEAIEKANALKKDDYKDFSAVQEAIDKVIRGKNITEQAEVDQMAKAIEDAIAALNKNKIGIFTYRITGKNTAKMITSTVNGDKKKNLRIFSTVKLNGKKYKVTSVAKNALKGNKKVRTLVVGKTTEKIGKSAFQNCKNLKKIIIKSKNLKKIGSNAFKGISKNAVVKVPKSKKKLYTKLLRASGLPKSVKIK